MIVCPLTHDASSLQTKQAAFAISSGCASRFAGCKSSKNLICSSVFPVRNISVSAGPGEMVFTLIPLAPRSLESVRDICSTAPLVAAYMRYTGGTVEACVSEVEKKTTRLPEMHALYN